MTHANPSRSQPLASLELQRAIDAICDDFEEAWVSGKRPRLSHYLTRLSEPVRAALFRELLATELALLGEVDNDAEGKYRQQYQPYEQVVASVFGEQPSPRAVDVSMRSAERYRSLIDEALSRLDHTPCALGGEELTAGYSENGRSPAGRAAWPETAPAAELWRLLIAHAEAMWQDGSQQDLANCLETTTRQLLAAFPVMRREVLRSLLAGTTFRDVAASYRLSERTVEMTHRAAVDLLLDK